MTHLVFTLTAKDDDELPDFVVKCIPGEGANDSELAAAMVISTTARLVIEQLVLCMMSSDAYQFRDDLDTIDIRERFNKCGIKVTVDREKLLKEMRRHNDRGRA